MSTEIEKPSEQATEKQTDTLESDTSASSQDRLSEEEQPSIEDQPTQQPVASDGEETTSRVTWSSLESKRRRFNYDIMPKVMMSCVH